MNEPEFKDYKERQNYYKERYQNRGKTIHVSKMIGHDGKIIQEGRTYEKKGVFRPISRRK